MAAPDEASPSMLSIHSATMFLFGELRMIKKLLFVFALCAGFPVENTAAQSGNSDPGSAPATSKPDPPSAKERGTSTTKDQDPTADARSKTDDAKSPRRGLAVKLRDEYWEAKDKKGAKRSAEPALFNSHNQMTREWIDQLTEEDFSILKNEDPTAEQAKRARQLLREYNAKSQEIAVRLALARRLGKKIIGAHWERLAQNGVLRTAVPEYARDFETAVESWFLDRSLEDLKIFEKTRPSKSERERGEKITAELINKIDEVKQKYEGKMR
jgi:hypothetical protein